ncbi:flagellar hook-basal body protein [Duganella sp. CY15W]|uniref:flagellar hook-basal body protein n=1 Tax=Duganella sp. CY15W TaxID=2692172 RepID=UPI0021021213|nr:flagellar hook-basal body protein [Duganella sp. CY15W]
MDVTAIAASGMQQDLRRIDSISQNMANVLTPGYKRQVLMSKDFSQQVQQGLAAVTALPAAGIAPGSATQLSIDASAGTLRYTGNPQDLAIDGMAFFEIATPEGPAYTRQGSLHTDARGRLVTAAGAAVMGAGGDIVVKGPFAVDANGDVRQGERVLTRLKLVSFANPEALLPLGGGAYAQGGARVAELDVAPSVRSGYQENSNVNTSQEMVRLSDTMRHFEALQRVIQGYDDSLEKTIRKLGEF